MCEQPHPSDKANENNPGGPTYNTYADHGPTVEADDEQVIEAAKAKGLRAFPASFEDTHAFAEQAREFLEEEARGGDYIPFDRDHMEPDVGPDGDS